MATKKDNTIRFKSNEKIVLMFIQNHNNNIVKSKQRIQKELAKLREIRFLKKLASNDGKSFDWLDQLEKDTESGIDMLKRWAKTNDKEIKEVEDNTIREPISLEEVQKAVKELQKNGVLAPYRMEFPDKWGNRIKVTGLTANDLYNNYLKKKRAL